MKKRLFFIIAIVALSLFVLPACKSMENFSNSSIKSISKPYIAQYECVEARFGDDDILKYCDYIRVIFLNDKKMEVVYKLKDSEKKSVTGKYSLDNQTRELDAELGIFGFKFKEKIKVEKGGFEVRHTILMKEVYMKFQTI